MALLWASPTWGANETSTQSTPVSERRVALVIGNGKYESGALENSVNDAKAIAKALRQYGFAVTDRYDINQGSMRRAIREFGDTIKGGGVGLFYFAGHGVQVGGRNYLLPVGTDIRDEEDIEDQAVDANIILSRMEAAKNSLNIVILDACRNNPFGSKFRGVSQGLAAMEAPTGTILAFSTAPGKVAIDKVSPSDENGLYTKHLLSTISQPGLKIEDAFKNVRINVSNESNGIQVPWENTSLTGDFYFLPAQKTKVVGRNEESLELAFWNSIKDSGNPAEFRAYLDKYPGGTFVELAKIKAGGADTARPPQRIFSTVGVWKGASRSNTSGVSTIGDFQVNTAGTFLYRSEYGEEMTGTLEQNGNVVVAVGKIKIPEKFKDQPVTVTYPGGAKEATLTFNGVLLSDSSFKGTYAGAGDSGSFEFTKQADSEAIYRGIRDDLAADAELKDVRIAIQKKDSKTAINLALPIAEGGNVLAAAVLGDLYRTAVGAEQDYKKAMNWLQRAAAKGNIFSIRAVGLMYFFGQGVPKDHEEALRWFRTAALKEDVPAMFYMGTMNLFGQGVRANVAEGTKWIRMCANRSHPSCQFQLGWIYETGNGVTKDARQAATLYRLAAEAGEPYSEFQLATLYERGVGVTRDEFEAAKLMEKAASQGHIPAEAELGRMYAQGIGLMRNDKEAFMWTKRAAEEGNAPAQNNLGVMYHYGTSVIKADAKEAEIWYSKSAAQGYELAKQNLQKLAVKQ